VLALCSLQVTTCDPADGVYSAPTSSQSPVAAGSPQAASSPVAVGSPQSKAPGASTSTASAVTHYPFATIALIALAIASVLLF
jgi:hypothetical protein